MAKNSIKELERRFLPRYLPDIPTYSTIELIEDFYIPASVEHPKMRLRRVGDRIDLQRKSVDGAGIDASMMIEYRIENISVEEFTAIRAIPHKKLLKKRISFTHIVSENPSDNYMIEFGIFLEDLEGLVVVDFEFLNEEQMRKFAMPRFCLKEVTNEEFLAGGMLCGRSYRDIEERLSNFGYIPLSLS